MGNVLYVLIRLRRVGERRTGLFRRVRPVYEIEILDDDRPILHGLTTTPLSILESMGQVHPVDSYDWRAAADRMHTSGSDEWVTDPFKPNPSAEAGRDTASRPVAKVIVEWWPEHASTDVG